MPTRNHGTDTRLCLYHLPREFYEEQERKRKQKQELKPPTDYASVFYLIMMGVLIGLFIKQLILN